MSINKHTASCWYRTQHGESCTAGRAYVPVQHDGQFCACFHLHAHLLRPCSSLSVLCWLSMLQHGWRSRLALAASSAACRLYLQMCAQALDVTAEPVDTPPTRIESRPGSSGHMTAGQIWPLVLSIVAVAILAVLLGLRYLRRYSVRWYSLVTGRCGRCMPVRKGPWQQQVEPCLHCMPALCCLGCRSDGCCAWRMHTWIVYAIYRPTAAQLQILAACRCAAAVKHDMR